MWLTPKDYFDFAHKCKIVYFQVDLPKLLDEIYLDAELLSGLTLDKLRERSMHFYNALIDSCPENMPFEQYLDQELDPDVTLYREILLAIHETFLDN